MTDVDRPMIDPRVPRIPSSQDDIDPPNLDTFTACHLLAFGTEYRFADYFMEARARVLEGALGSSGGEGPTPSHEAADRANAFELVEIYLGVLDLGWRLKAAALVLVEAAARAELSAVGWRREDRYEVERLLPEDFVGRGPISFTTGLLYSRTPGRDGVIEMQILNFQRDQILDLRKKTWHRLPEFQNVEREGQNPDEDWRPSRRDRLNKWILRPAARREAELRRTKPSLRNLACAFAEMAKKGGREWTAGSIETTMRDVAKTLGNRDYFTPGYFAKEFANEKMEKAKRFASPSNGDP